MVIGSHYVCLKFSWYHVGVFVNYAKKIQDKGHQKTDIIQKKG